MFYRLREKLAIYDSIYLDIVISDDGKKLKQEFGYTDDIEEWYACVFKHTFGGGENTRWKKSVVIVLNPYHPSVTNGIETRIIVHEIIHLKNRILNLMGYKCKPLNDEHEAYFSEFLFDKVETFYKKVIEKENKLKIIEDGK